MFERFTKGTTQGLFRIAGLSYLLVTVLLVGFPLDGHAKAKSKAKVPKLQTGAILSDEYKAVRDQAMPLITKLRKKYKVNGFSIALIDGDKLVWAEGFGYSDLGKKKKARAETVYRIGSISKPITATAVMQLAEQDSLDIDNPVKQYVPEFSVQSRFEDTDDSITIRSVLSHHSGLPTDIRKGMWTNQPLKSVVELLKEDHLAYPPNLIFNYSNIGYSLLGHMLQEHTGNNFSEHMTENLFKPLGMTATDYRVRKDMKKMLSRGYNKKKAGKLPPIRDLPAFSLYSNVMDMGQFIKMYLSGGELDGKSILKQETLNELMKVQNHDVELDMSILNGLGWYINHGYVKGAGRVVRHGGATMLFSSELMMLPNEKLGVVVLSNTKGSAGILKSLARRVLKYSVAQKNAGKENAVATSNQRRRFAKVTQLVPEGKYATALGVISVDPKTNKICLCDIKRRLKIVPQPGGWYSIPKKSVGKKLPSGFNVLPNMEISSRLVNKREVIVAKRRGKEFLLGERVRDEKIPKKWKRRVGRYKVLNPDSGFEIKNTRVGIENGILNISYKVPKLSNKVISVPIRPISDNKAIVLGLGRMRGEVLQVVMVDGRECLKYSGYLVRKI